MGEPVPLRWRRWTGSVRVGRASWTEPRAPKQRELSHGRLLVQKGSGEDSRAAGVLNAAEAKAANSLAVAASILPASPRQTPVLRVESEREALERRSASHRLAEALVAQLGGQGGTGLEAPAELAVSKAAEAARLQAQVAALQEEKRLLEEELEATGKSLCEETRRADKAEGELRESRAALLSNSNSLRPGTAVTGEDLALASTSAPMPDSDLAADPESATSPGPGGGGGQGDVGLKSTSRTPREHVELIRKERMEGFKSPALREMFIGCIELLAADIYASQAHFVLELLQNADDNDFRCLEGEVPTAHFSIRSASAGRPAYITVANNEVGLSQEDVLGLCAISKSSKAGKKDRTGRKGIGFKSVFAISACPHVLSGAYSFKFDAQADRLGYITPTWLQEQELAALPLEVRQMQQQGLTCIYLPLAPGAPGAEGLLSEVRRQLESLDPATLLFLRRLRRIEVQADGDHFTVLEYGAASRPQSGLLREVVTLSSGADAYPTGPGGSGGPSEMREYFVHRARVGATTGGQLAVALPVAYQGPQKAFATLPLCDTGLAVAVNADWDVSASRDGIHENWKNESLVAEAAKAFSQAVKDLGLEQLHFGPLDYLGDRAPLNRFWRRARERFLRELLADEVPCVPVEEFEEEDLEEELQGCLWRSGTGAAPLATPARALRRPTSQSSAAEQKAAALVEPSVLLQCTGRRFAKEPLPPGLELQVFGLSHYLQCLPQLVQAQLSSAQEETEMETETSGERCAAKPQKGAGSRSRRLADLFSVLLELLREPGASVGGAVLEPAQRVELLRAASIFPVRLLGQGFATAALADGPIFASLSPPGPSQGGPIVSGRARHYFLPQDAASVPVPGRLRVLTEEARGVLPQESLEWLGLHTHVADEHLLGLSADLHLSDAPTKGGELMHFWASLEVIRASLSGRVWAQDTGEEEGKDQDEKDSLLLQGRILMRHPERLASILMVPAVDGSVRRAESLHCATVLGVALGDDTGDEGLKEPVAEPRPLRVWASRPPLGLCVGEGLPQDLEWECFFLQTLRMESCLLQLLQPQHMTRAEVLCGQLTCCEWWTSVAAAGMEDYVQWFVQANSETLSALPCKGWSLQEHFAADFAAFFGQSRVAGRPLPLFPATAAELPPLARKCLLTLGATLFVEDKVLVERCAPLLLAAGETAPADGLACIYASLGPCEEELLETLRKGLCVPGQASPLAADECLYLPEALRGLGKLVQKADLGACFPELAELMAQLGIPDSVSPEVCLAALRELKARTEGLELELPAAAETLSMTTAAYRQLLRHLQPSRGPLLAGEPLVLILSGEAEPNKPGQTCHLAVSSKLRRASWRSAQSCMWYDVPSGQQHRCPSLQAHYPSDLKEFFVGSKGEGAVEIDANEVFSRLAETAQREDAALVLAGAYAEINALRGNSSLLTDEPLRLALGAGVQVPGIGVVPTEDTVFLAVGDDFSHFAGIVDLGVHFPDLRAFFTDYLGVRTALPVQEVLMALRRLRAGNAGDGEEVRRLAISAYRLLALSMSECPDAGRELAAAFREEALVLASASSSSSSSSSSCWRTADTCVWSDAPPGLRAQRDSLEPHYPQDLMALFEALGVRVLDAEEVTARLQQLVALEGEEPGDAREGNGHGNGNGNGHVLRQTYAAISSLCEAGVALDDAAVAALRGSLLVPGLGVVAAGKCLYVEHLHLHLAGGSKGAEKLLALAGKVNLATFYPECHSLFTSLGLPAQLSAEDCLSALEALASRAGREEEESELREAAQLLYQHLGHLGLGLAAEVAESEGPAAAGRRPESILVPGRGFVDRLKCVCLEERSRSGLLARPEPEPELAEPELAELLGKIDLGRHFDFPGYRHCFVGCLGVPGRLSVPECLQALRLLSAEVDTGARAQGQRLHLATAAYNLLAEVAPQTPRLRDLSITFEEEALLLVGPTGEESWQSVGACMWHNAPMGLQQSRASLELHYPSEFRDFFVEGLGVPGLDAAEVAGRLDSLLAQGGGLARFAEAYAQICSAAEACERWGSHPFRDPQLLECLGRRIFVPKLGFVAQAQCLWQSSHRRGSLALPGLALGGRHNLLEVYEGLPERKVVLLRKLKNYFVDGLQVAEFLSVEECLESLRGLQGRRTPRDHAVAKALYCNLAQSLKAQVADDTAAVAKAFKKECLIYVPGPEGGHFYTSDRCIWRGPAEAPEGWEPSRQELAPSYGDEVALKRLFTEQLGVPMSVRFGPTQEGEREMGDRSLQRQPPGQPVWLYSSSEGKALVPLQQRPVPAPVEEAEEAEEAEAEEAEAEAEAGAEDGAKDQALDAPAHLTRGYAAVDGSGDEGEGGEAGEEPSKEQKEAKPERDKAKAGHEGRGEVGGESRPSRGPSRFTLPSAKSKSGTAPGPAAGREKREKDRDDTQAEAEAEAAVPDDKDPVPPPPEPHSQVRGIAADGRAERKRLLMKLSRSVNASGCRQVNSQASRIKHRPEESIDCNPEHDIERWAVLELQASAIPADSAPLTIPVWVERQGRVAAVRRLEAARSNGELEKFSTLLMCLGELFSIPCRDRINIFEEDTQAVAFNGGALYFNLRYFVEERHAESWEDAVSFWTISFAHELAHFESLIHDRLHGRTMEHTQRAVLPGLPRILSRPWGCHRDAPQPRWRLLDPSGD